RKPSLFRYWRTPSANLARQAAELLQSNLTRLVHVERADEMALGIHQIKAGGMIHCVLAPSQRHTSRTARKGPHHSDRFLSISPQCEDAVIKGCHVLSQQFLCVPFGIDGEEQDVELVGHRPELVHEIAQFIERRRAHIGTMGEAEEGEIRLSGQRSIVDRLASMGCELERAADGCRACRGRDRHGLLLPRLGYGQADEKPADNGDGDPCNESEKFDAAHWAGSPCPSCSFADAGRAPMFCTANSTSMAPACSNTR